MADRERKIEWMRTQADCPACYKAAQAAATGAKLAAYGDLPTLTGSTKQVDWANGIRRRLLTAVDEAISGWIAKVAPETLEAHQDRYGRVRQILAGRADAKFWIDRRDWTAKQVVREITVTFEA